MKPILTLILFFSFILFSCKDKDAEQEKINLNDSLRVTRDFKLFEQEEIDWISSATGKYLRETDIKLTEEGVDTFTSRAFTPTRDFLKNYAGVLQWSKDSSKLLDLGSYGSVFTLQNGNNKIEPGEPDTEVAYIDMAERKRYRLMYFGPSTEMVDGRWINNQEVMIITRLYDPGKLYTNITVINVKDGAVKKYELQ